MKIGIIGVGNIGGTLARKFSKLGHQVEVSNSRGPATLAAFAVETGVEPVDIGQVVRDKDVVVIAMPVAGDNAGDKEVIFGLIHQLGFDALDAGTLAESWRQQPGAPAYCMDLGTRALITALGKAEHSRMGEYRRNAVAGAKIAVEAAGSLAAAMAGEPLR